MATIRTRVALNYQAAWAQALTHLSGTTQALELLIEHLSKLPARSTVSIIGSQVTTNGVIDVATKDVLLDLLIDIYQHGTDGLTQSSAALYTH